VTTVEALKGVMLETGAGWVLWLLGALSVASLAVVIERCLVLRRADVDLRALGERLDGLLHEGRRADAISMLDRAGGPAAAIAAAGLRLSERGTHAVERAMRSASALHRGLLEQRLAFLATLGTNAPFLGLLGTVIGVVQAFEQLGREGVVAAQGPSEAVMVAIAEALVATAVGLLVALPAVAFHNWLARRVTAILDGADVLSNLVLAYLSAEPEGERA